MMKWSRHGLPTAVVVASAVGCSEPPNGPGPGPGPDNTIVSVALTSPIGDRMALGRQLQLSATATNSSGAQVSTSFSWLSSDDAVASVSGSGLVEGLGPGPTTISATAEEVSGELAVTVVDADLDGIGALVNDGYADALIDALSGPASTTLAQAFADCADAVDQGHINNLAACLGTAGTAVAAGGSDEEQLFLTYLALYVNRADELLNLE